MDKSSIISTDWKAEEKHLRDFVKQFPLPSLGKVKRGQYSCIGSGKKLHDVVYIHSIYASQCVVAESHFSGKNPKLFAIPLSFGGWFDVLSEDKKSVKPISNASELSKCSSKLFLVRENSKTNPGFSLETSRKSRDLEAGELLKRNEKQESSKLQSMKLLSFQDENNRMILLDSTHRFSLSPISKNDEVAGVHSIQNLVEHFSFPTTVQLAHGEFFSSTTYHPIFRLLGMSDIEFAIVIPLKAASQVLSIPLSELLVLSPPRDPKMFKDCDKFRIIYKFAQTIESQQQKTISLTADGSSRIYKNKICQNDEAPTKSSDAENLAYEEIDVIYKYIREGGKLSDFNTKNDIDDRINDAANVLSRTRPLDAVEREIWDEPIYADVSKLKARKHSKNKSEDSELANIGMEKKAGEESKMNSSYKKTLQKYRNQVNSTLQRKFVELEFGDNHLSEDRSNSAQQQIHANISTHGHWTSYPSNKEKSEHKNSTIKSTKLIQGIDPTENSSRANLQNLKESTSESKHFQELNNNNIGDATVVKIATGSKVFKDMKASLDEESGWNFSILKDEQDENSKKTCVKINYDPSTKTDDSELQKENHELSRVETSEDRSTITFKQTLRTSDVHQPNINSSELGFPASVSKGIETLNDTENSPKISSIQIESTVFHQPQNASQEPQISFSAVASPDSVKDVYFNTNSKSFTSSESPPVFSENVSTIRLGSPGNTSYFQGNNHSNQTQRQEDVQSVKIVCNKRSNFGGTLSSLSTAFACKETDERTENHQHALGDQSNNHFQNSNYTTTIKIDKMGSSQPVMQQNSNNPEKQVIYKSPFGNTQIYVRQAFPSSSSPASKLYVNKTFF